MSDDPSASVGGCVPPAIPDHDMRLLISAELGGIRRLVGDDALTIEGLQRLNHWLVPQERITTADAPMNELREVLIAEVHARLVEHTTIPLDYWQYPHRIEIPDDASGIHGPPRQSREW